MKISKEFRWEMGHRLPLHNGLCRNVHGHSYKMLVEISGEMNKEGMIIDFFDLGRIINPIVKKYDHAFMCWDKDLNLKSFLVRNKMKRVVVSYHSTVENICSDFSKLISKKLKALRGYRINDIKVRIFETPNSYAETKVSIG